MILLVVAGGVLLVGFGAKKVVNASEEWTRFDNDFKVFGAAYDVDWRWLKAIALNESNLGREKSVKRGLENPTDIEGSKSSDGLSWGLMQVTIKTAKGIDSSATEVKLNDPKYSISLAAQYVAQLKKMFLLSDSRFMEWVIKSYNQGPGNTKKEMNRQISGYANEYWNRFQRNLNKVLEG